MQLVVPPSDAIHFIYIMNCGLWAIRIGFGKQSNPEELGIPWKGFSFAGWKFLLSGKKYLLSRLSVGAQGEEIAVNEARSINYSAQHFKIPFTWSESKSLHSP